MRNINARAGALIVCAALALVLASCHTQRYGNDWVSSDPSSTGTPVWGSIRDDMNYSASSTFPNNGIQHILNDVNGNCINITGGGWGTTGTVNTISSATVSCFIDNVLDDPNDANDVYSSVCDDQYNSGTGNVANDCQDPDGSGNYHINVANTAFYRDLVAGTFASPSTSRATIVLEWARDWQVRTVTEGGHTDYPDCYGWAGSGTPAAHIICPS